jgi:ABC-type transport system involved in multi-copper enzyme maturation permease subunit
MTGSSSFFRLWWNYTRLRIASAGYRAMTTGMVLLLVIASMRGGRETAQAIDTYRTAVADEHSAWNENTAEEWIAAGVRKGRWLYLPPLPSQALAEGASKLQHSSCHARVGIAPAHRLDLTDGSLSWAPELRRLGSLDLGYVVLFLLPLWALLVTYDAVSGEKQRGTLRGSLVLGTSRARILGAKLLSGLAVVGFPAAAAILSGLLCSMWFHRAPPIDAGRLLVFLVLLASYLLFYLCVGLVGSTCTASPRTSLALVMMVWVFCSFLQPRANALAVGLLRPLPSAVSFEIKKRGALAEARRSYVEEHHSGTNQNWMLERLALAQTAIERERALQREYDAQRESSRSLTDTVTWFSPFGLAQSVLVDVAGTSAQRYQRFQSSCNDYRWQLTRHFAAGLDAVAPGTSAALAGPPAARARAILDRTPVFDFREIDGRTLALNDALRVSALLAVALALAVVAMFQFTRYDAR